jgi:hypothetical protein
MLYRLQSLAVSVMFAMYCAVANGPKILWLLEQIGSGAARSHMWVMVTSGRLCSSNERSLVLVWPVQSFQFS